jgi:hypothetical protein
MNDYINVFRNELGKKQVLSEYDSILNSLGVVFEDRYI